MTLSELSGQVSSGYLFAQKQPSILDGMGFLPIVAIVLLFIFMIYLPDKKRRRQQEESLNSLKKNDRVQTIGGILGIVVNVNKTTDEVTLKVDEGNNIKLRFKRSAIANIIVDEKGDKKDED